MLSLPLSSSLSRANLNGRCRDPDARATVKRHIGLLQAYNDIRDAGMALLGLIAEQRGVRVADVYAEFGVETKTRARNL